MGCAASRQRSVSVQQATPTKMVPINPAAAPAAAAAAGAAAGAAPSAAADAAAAHQQGPAAEQAPAAERRPPLVFAAPTQADSAAAAAAPASPLPSDRSLDMLVVEADDLALETPPSKLRRRHDRSGSYTPSAETVETRSPPRRSRAAEPADAAEQLLRGQRLLQEAQESLAAARRADLPVAPSPSSDRLASRLASRYPGDRPDTRLQAANRASPWKERSRAARVGAHLSPSAANRRARVAPSGFRINRASPSHGQRRSPQGEPAEQRSPTFLRGRHSRKVQLGMRTAGAPAGLRASAALSPSERADEPDALNFDQEMDVLAQLETMLRSGVVPSPALQAGLSDRVAAPRGLNDTAEELSAMLRAEPSVRPGMLHVAESELDALMRREMELLDEGKGLLDGAEVEFARAMMEADNAVAADQAAAASEAAAAAEKKAFFEEQLGKAEDAYSFERRADKRENKPLLDAENLGPEASRPRRLAPIAGGDIAMPKKKAGRRALQPLDQNAGDGRSLGMQKRRSAKPTTLGRRATQPATAYPLGGVVQ